MTGINKKFKYWEFYYDETNDENVYPTEKDRQCIGSVWSDEWSGLELFNYTDEDLKTHLLQDVEDKWKYGGEKINKGLVRHAIAEFKKIKEELKIL
jgi:hypothetical protein